MARLTGRHLLRMTIATVIACVTAIAIATPASAVIGGQVVKDDVPDANAYRFVGRLVDGDGDMFCTVSLVAPRVALTARHCVDQYQDNPRVFRVQVGMLGVRLDENDRTVDAYDGFTTTVQSISLGRRYFCVSGADGLALLNLENAVPASVATPVRLAGSDDGELWKDNRKVFVAGWGYSEEKHGWTSVLAKESKLTSQLRRGEMKIENQTVTVSTCRGALKTDNFGRGRAAHGDSGGPLITYDEYGPIVIGALSGGVNGDNYWFKTGVDDDVKAYWKS